VTDTTTRSRMVTVIRERVAALIPGPGMSRRDRQAWASATTWADLGERVAFWLHGEIQRTPGHCGPPCEETIPLIPVLTAVNRAGFVTDNSQPADGPREAWVCGFAPEDVLASLREAIAGTPLVLESCCRRRDHHHGRRRYPCPRRGAAGFWADACPALADEIRGAWYVTITDPGPGRNDRLWPALAGFAWRRS
jgi:hypothetical protein